MTFLRRIMLMQKSILGGLLLSLLLGGFGCGYNQEVKDVWKGTKDFWYENVSVPASIDYDAKGDMEEYKAKLASNMIGIDAQLTDLEKIMSNADKPPTNEWVENLFRRFPWINGFTGVKADGSILGQVPGPPIKPLDFSPLLAEDKKQNLRALRGYVQNTAMGPEVFLATPLYDAHTFLGIVSVYFDMRELLDFAVNPDELVIVSPYAVLWSGKYNFAATPLSGIAWGEITLEASSGTVTNANGQFYWSMRYFGNLPLIFAVPIEGSFGESSSSRTGPVDSTGLVESPPIVYVPTVKEDSDVASDPQSADGEEKVQGGASSLPPTFMPEKPAPEVVEEKPAPVQKKRQVKRASPRPVPMPAPRLAPPPPPKAIETPSPFYSGDEEDSAASEPTATEESVTESNTIDDADSTSIDSAVTTDESDVSAEDAETSDSVDNESDTNNEPAGFSRPSPFGAE